MTTEELAKIRWAPRLRPMLLKRLYETDAQGIHAVGRLVESCARRQAVDSVQAKKGSQQSDDEEPAPLGLSRK